MFTPWLLNEVFRSPGWAITEEVELIRDGAVPETSAGTHGIQVDVSGVEKEGGGRLAAPSPLVPTARAGGAWEPEFPQSDILPSAADTSSAARKRRWCRISRRILERPNLPSFE